MAKNKNKFLLLVSGVGGSGKDSILQILRRQPERFVFSVSYTDKKVRDDEIPGHTYHYISKEEFDKSIEKGEFVEWEQTRGEYRYGRKKDELNETINSGKIPVAQIDVLGAAKFKKMSYDTVSVFIVPPSKEEAEARLKKRGTDSPEQQAVRLERYDFEMSFKNQYDHIIVNDDLKRAQKEIQDIVRKELNRRKSRFNLRKALSLFGLIAFTALFIGAAATYAFPSLTAKLADVFSSYQQTSESNSPASTQSDEPAGEVAAVATPPSSEVKREIAKAPPKRETPSTSPVAETKTNSDGSQTVVVSTGDSSGEDVSGLSNISVNSVNDIVYKDETGQYASLETVLKSYLADTLKTKSEITTMKQITVKDAGASGWAGQYLGQYTISADGADIISATGSIILNVYYYKDSPLFTDYMKLVLSHEYGHHYTLYHKWVDWDLPMGARFPDSYYATRPLSKTTTATDYSLGWSNCEAEIIAEDYSYLYSGYGIHGMSSTYGYPSAAMENWFEGIGSQALLSPPAPNNPPLVSITSPAEAAVLFGSVSFSADASDDVAVSKVSFYIDSTLLSEDTAAPYSTSLNSAGYTNGSHVLKAIASDGSLTAEKTITVTVQNEVADAADPAVVFIFPDTNPYAWLSGDLGLRVRAEDDIGIAKVEIYVNDQLSLTTTHSNFVATWQYASVGPGEYTVRAKAYDTSGKTAEVTTIVNKS